MFLKAAQLLGVDPARAPVVEDATAGVESARRGGFGLVVGIDRGEQREALLAAGAHIVLGDVSQLDLGALRADPWALVYEGFDPAHEGHREALITLGNGYMGTRGAAPESSADGVHYPGTYLAGVYNRLTSNVHGRAMEDESLVNVPNWLVLDVRVGEAEWWSAGGLTTTQERRELDLRRGVLSRSAVLTDSTGRRLRLTQRRLVSMARPHVAALETTLVAAGWTGPVSIRCGVDAGVTNGNVAEYRGLADRHLRTVAAEVTEQGTILVEVETTQSQVRIATGARVTLTGTGTPAATRVEQEGDRTMHRFDLVLLDGEPVTVDKTVAIRTWLCVVSTSTRIVPCSVTSAATVRRCRSARPRYSATLPFVTAASAPHRMLTGPVQPSATRVVSRAATCGRAIETKRRWVRRSRRPVLSVSTALRLRTPRRRSSSRRSWVVVRPPADHHSASPTRTSRTNQFGTLTRLSSSMARPWTFEVSRL